MCDTLTQILKEKKNFRMFPQFTIYAEADITTHVKYRKHAPSLDISVKTHTAQFALPATRKFSHRWEIFFPVYIYSFSSVICCFAITLHTPHTVAYSNALEVLNDTLLRLHAGEEEGRRQQKGEYENLWMKKSCRVSNVSLDSALNKCMRQHIDTRESVDVVTFGEFHLTHRICFLYSRYICELAMFFKCIFFAKHTTYIP